ncbi:RNA polymerase sigma-70 factor [Chitinophaga solisilvae]|uniref:RNA polymerase sigma-70 factor n=1 Tax=Chitinophaga solisilvae TaxID=1233460 RepID=A0A3S1CYY1_9BACT|nr:RNA polymerase sigma-70 factor [Chitinophaga solisilvae]NSL87631.1 RNA polymerase sigma-70 factor [Chitinophaga solisilvae]
MAADQNKLDSEEFDNHFREHYNWLCYCAVKVTKDMDVARDLVQDFFVYFWTNRDRLQIEGSFKSYASRAVLNIAVSHMRHTKIREENNSAIAGEEADNSFDTGTALQEQEFRISRLFEAINELPEQRKRILIMHQFGKLKYAEIADKLSLSKNTVKTHLKLAYKILRENLDY